MKHWIGVVTTLVLIAGCEGPVGPQGVRGPQGVQGEQGPQGERGPRGLPPESTFIRVGNLSPALYDGFGRIIVENSLITPKTFRGVYIEVFIEDWSAFFEPFQIFDVEISDGRLIIHDPDHFLISYRDGLKRYSLERDGVETASFEDADFVLMVLVQ